MSPFIAHLLVFLSRPCHPAELWSIMIRWDVRGKNQVGRRCSPCDRSPREMPPVLRMKVGVSRKEATDRDGSVSATCEIEVEIPGSATDEEVLRIRDHWLEVCEATVDEELD